MSGVRLAHRELAAGCPFCPTIADVGEGSNCPLCAKRKAFAGALKPCCDAPEFFRRSGPYRVIVSSKGVRPQPGRELV